MNAERLTESALQMVASAQQVARARQHQNITPLHLATALLADATSPAARVLERAGGTLAQVQAGLNAALERLPQVSGADGQYMSNEMAQVFDEAERLAGEWKDSFVAADTLLVAARDKGSKDLSHCYPQKTRSPAPPRRYEGVGPWTVNQPKVPLRRSSATAST